MITGAEIRKLLVYPITFHRVFSEVGGGVTAGLLLSQLFYLADKHADDEGWFYHSAKVLMDETTLTRTEFDNARKKLLERGIIDEARRGVPAQMHWRVNFDHLANLIAGNPQTEVQKRRAPDRGKPAGQNAGNPQSLTDHKTDQNKATNGLHPQEPDHQETNQETEDQFIARVARQQGLNAALATRLAHQHRAPDGQLRRIEFEGRCHTIGHGLRARR
jgi:hypothetical protein